MNLPQALSYENTLLIWKIDWVLRKIGRIAFPIFCFLLVEGFIHTSNRKKYALRLALFALLSEIPFDLCFRGKFLEFSYQNVMITLLVGFLAITAMDEARKRVPALALVAAAAGLLLGYLLKTDYSYRGVILIILLYLFQSYPLEKTIAAVSLFCGNRLPASPLFPSTCITDREAGRSNTFSISFIRCIFSCCFSSAMPF